MIFSTIAIENLAQTLKDHEKALSEYAKRFNDLPQITDPTIVAALQPITALTMANYAAITQIGRTLSEYLMTSIDMDALSLQPGNED